MPVSAARLQTVALSFRLLLLDTISMLPMGGICLCNMTIYGGTSACYVVEIFR